MRLATLRDGTRDGALIVVGRDGDRYARAADVAPTLQAALDDWDARRRRWPRWRARLDAGRAPASRWTSRGSARRCRAPTSGSTARRSSTHVRRVRAARGAAPPATLETDPLVYQGGSGVLLGPRDDIPLGDPGLGPRLRERGRGDPGRHAAGNARRRRARARAAADARQRRHAAQAGARRAGEGLRLLPVEAGDRVLAVRGHARRAGRRLARRPRPPAAADVLQRRARSAIPTRARCTSRSSI